MLWAGFSLCWLWGFFECVFFFLIYFLLLLKNKCITLDLAMENLQFHVLEKLELKYLLILKMPLSSPEACEMFYI